MIEIQALQSQINPHFLYNTLASIRFMLEMDMPEKVDLALLSLVKLLKRTFSKADKMITLSEEFESVEHYLNLLRLHRRILNIMEPAGSQKKPFSGWRKMERRHFI